MKLEMIFSGVGGQGVMSIGELYCGSVAKKDKIVTFCPTYGAEKRGGKTMCQIVVSDEMCAPVSSYVDLLMVMDEKSLNDYLGMIKPKGVLIVNSSIITKDIERNDIDVYRVPFNDMAVNAGNAKCANMIALGSIMKFQDILTLDELKAELPEIFPGKKAKLIPLNETALDLGFDIAN